MENTNLLLDLLLKARILIARMGERDLMDWWDVEAQSESGIYALNRIFKYSAKWAAYEVSLLAAGEKIDAVLTLIGMKKSEYIHLFKINENLDSMFWGNFYNQKRKSLVDNKSCFLDSTNIKTFEKIYSELGLKSEIIKDIKQKIHKVADRQILNLGFIDKETLMNQDRALQVISDLIVGYEQSEKGSLIIPIYRLKL